MENKSFPHFRHPALILASGSPRRAQLLRAIGIELSICATDIDETVLGEWKTESVAEHLALAKAKAAKALLPSAQIPILAADTIVICQSQLLPKPIDTQKAKDFLHLLSGKTHQVITGYAVLLGTKMISKSVITEVTFAELKSSLIDYYVANYNPVDKAGGYGIQEWIGMIGISGIRGDYYNVMGLPLHALLADLEDF